MDTFTAIVVIGLVVVIGTFLLLGRFSGRRVQDITDKGQNAKLGAMAAIEDRDVGQMVEGQNAYRRRRGAPERTEEEVRRAVGEEQRERLRDDLP